MFVEPRNQTILYISELYVTYLDKTNEQWNYKQQHPWQVPQNLILQLLKGLNIFLVLKESIWRILIATHLLKNNSRNNLERSLLCQNDSKMSLLTVTSDTVVQLSDVVCATFNNPNFIAIPTIAEKVVQLMQSKVEQLIQEAIHPHLQPLLDKQVILEETISQLPR